jgi:hypothetical protein
MGDLLVIFPQHPPKLHLSLIVRVFPTPGELVMRSVDRDFLTIPFVTAPCHRFLNSPPKSYSKSTSQPAT